MKIENQKLTVKEAFKNYYYIVPPYQRDYVWQTKNVEQLLTDIHDEFQIGDQTEYFIGCTVANRAAVDSATYEVIDGQQRLTTLFLALCAFRILFSGEADFSQLILQLISSAEINEKGKIVKNPRLILQYEDSFETVQRILEGEGTTDNLTGASLRIRDAFDTIQKYLSANFSTGEALKEFYGYFTNKVSFIQIETPSINDALKIFETINDRGIGLNPMDLLKNLIFRQLPKSDFDKVNAEWKVIRDALDKNNVKPLRFLRYFLMANYQIEDPKGTETLYEDQLYPWITENDKKCHYTTEPMRFVKTMQQNANSYVRFSKGEDGVKKNMYLENIRHLGGGSFSLHLIPLLSGKDLHQDLFDHLAKQIEALIFYYTVTRVLAKEFESKFSKWAKKIGRAVNLSYGNAKTALNDIIISDFTPELNGMAADFDVQFLSLGLHSLQSYKIKYILAKLTAYVDAERIGRKEQLSLLPYLQKKIEIEHILPQRPEEDLLNTFPDKDSYDRAKNRLGNLTLLEKPINVVAGRQFFKDKVKLYTNSNFYLTKSLAAKDEVGADTTISRLNKKLLSFTDWNSEAIDIRQKMLLNLAKEVWRIEPLP